MNRQSLEGTIDRARSPGKCLGTATVSLPPTDIATPRWVPPPRAATPIGR